MSAGLDACVAACDPLDDAPTPQDIAEHLALPECDHAARLASLPPEEARVHARNLAAWHTPGSGPDPLASVLAPYQATADEVLAAHRDRDQAALGKALDRWRAQTGSTVATRGRPR